MKIRQNINKCKKRYNVLYDEFECKNHIFIKHMINLKTPNQFVLKCSSSKTLDKPVTSKGIKKKKKQFTGQTLTIGMDRHYQKMLFFFN